MSETVNHFNIGQPVEVVPSFRHGEWRGIPLWIVAVRAIERSQYDVSYDVSERWPVQAYGDVTTDFSPDDLQARASSPEGEGK